MKRYREKGFSLLSASTLPRRNCVQDDGILRPGDVHAPRNLLTATRRDDKK
jgi:hypothetical protein